MLDCKQVLAGLSDYLDDDVSPEFRRALEQHLAICHRCSIVFDTTRKTLKIVADVAAFDVSPAASVRLYRWLQEFFVGRQSSRSR